MLLNPGADEGLDSWTPIEGVFEVLTDGECDGISPHTGETYFGVGGVCEESAYGKTIQNVDVSAYADSIATGDFQANFGGYLSNFGGSDLPEMWLVFLNEEGDEVGITTKVSSLSNVWTMFSEWVDLPLTTTTISFVLAGTRNTGVDNDSYLMIYFSALAVKWMLVLNILLV